MQYEIEIKALLGSKEQADALLERTYQEDPSTSLISEQRQLNHYFKGGTIPALIEQLRDHLSVEQRQTLETISQMATSINVRSRQKNDTVLLIVKGAVGGSAVHAHDRMEFEGQVNLSIDELDEAIIASGWQLEAKWQADRKLYNSCGLTIDLFFTPGYGYLAEFEKVVHDESDRANAHQTVVDVMTRLGVSELDPARLERMFEYYNQHWPEYYGTDKVFVVE